MFRELDARIAALEDRVSELEKGNESDDLQAQISALKGQITRLRNELSNGDD